MNDSVKGVVAPSSDPIEMLIGRIVEHEGMKKFAYKDTMGYITCGIGRCLQEGVGKGLSVDECFMMLRNDISDFRGQLAAYPWFKCQDDIRQGALIELCFNMGLAHLLQFKNMLDAIGRKSYPEASKELLSSKWAQQVGKARSEDIAYRISVGRYK